MVDSFAKGIYRKRRESETSAARQKRCVQLVRIVCDYAESGIRSIPIWNTEAMSVCSPKLQSLVGIYVGNDRDTLLFHNSPQCILGSASHCISFIQDDQFETPKFTICLGGCPENLFRRCKCFDLFADNLDTSIIRSIQLEDLLADVMSPINMPRQRKNCRGFAGSRRPIEKQMGKSLERISALKKKRLRGCKNTFVLTNLLTNQTHLA